MLEDTFSAVTLAYWKSSKIIIRRVKYLFFYYLLLLSFSKNFNRSDIPYNFAVFLFSSLLLLLLFFTVLTVTFPLANSRFNLQSVYLFLLPAQPISE